MEPKVSVIIPLYNKSSSILRTLDSITNQTFSDLEIIVIDDGSTDCGLTIVEGYPDSRLRILKQANLGPGAARNAGLKDAKGVYIAFLDADDEWLPTYLQSSVSRLDSLGESVASVTSGYYEYPANKSMENFWRNRGLTDGVQKLDESTPAALAVYMLAFMSSWSTLAHRDILVRLNGFYDKNKCVYGEDSYLWLKVLLNNKVYFNLQPLVRYHREDSALAGNLGRPRPIEPFLTDPVAILDACPEDLKPLLGDILALKAAKTACMYGYWGNWKHAAAIRKLYVNRHHWRLPYFFLSGFCALPISPVFATLARGISKILISIRYLQSSARMKVQG